MKNTWRNYLVFTKKEGRGLMVLFVVLVILLILPERLVKPVNVYKVDSVNTGDREMRKFRFNPNQITKEQWMALGATEKTANTILNYRSKGGSFRQPTDLYKIWGMPAVLADSLIPWIEIPQRGGHQEKAYANTYEVSNSVRYPRFKRREIASIDINTADQASWESLPGIGPVLAARIIRFRDKLGSFASVEQIAKTYGLADSVFQKIQPFLRVSVPSEKIVESMSGLSIISLNNSREKDMIAAGVAPFIAKAIVVYRKEKGAFKSTEELKNIVFISDSMYAILREKFRID